jgi:hypothetical protein
VPAEITVHRDVAITPVARSLQGLVDELTALIAKNTIGPDAVVESISGNVGGYRLTLTKPD